MSGDVHVRFCERLGGRFPGATRLVLLGDDKARLWDAMARIETFLEAERLRLHPRKARIGRTRDGLDLLGYRVFPDFRLLRDDNGHRFARRLRAFARGYAAGRIEWADVDPSVQSWLGHARHADTLGLRERLLPAVAFRRRPTGRAPPLMPGDPG